MNAFYANFITPKWKQWCVTIISIFALFLSASGQETAQRKITITFNQQSLTDCLDKITALTGIRFYYEGNEIKQITGKHTAAYTAQPLSVVLKALLSGTDFEWQEVNQRIAIKRKSTPPAKPVNNPPVPKQVVPGSGFITGTIVDFENGDPLPGASVSIEGKPFTTVSDPKGIYELRDVPEGSYTLVVSYIGYQQTRLQHLKVNTGKLVVDVKLQVRSTTAGAVEVTAIRRKKVANTSDAQLVQELYKAKTIISGISNEQIARTLDRDAAEIVKRVPGVNISEDNFVIVRGLNKRYNITFLNDAMAPATDADSRSFSYDVINSNAIDRIMVHKSPSPDLPGEFSGGLVKIYTKKSQLTRQIDIQASMQYRQGSTFENIWSYAGGKYDFLGFDDGTRKLPEGIPGALTYNHLTPAENARYGRQFKNIYVLDKSYKPLPDLRLNANYYNAWRIGGRYLKNLTTIAFTNTHQMREIEQNSLYKYYDGNITQGIHAARISAIQNNEISLNDRLTVELRHFVNINNQRIAVEDYRKLVDYDKQEFRHTNLYYEENKMYSGQLSANYLLGKDKKSDIKAGLSYSTIHKREPDNRDYTLRRATGGAKEEPWSLGTELISFYMLSRVFTDVKEDNYQANVDLNYRITDTWGFKTGFYHSTRTRDFSNRTFILVNGVNLYDPNLSIAGSKYISDNGQAPSHKNPVYEKYLQHYFNQSMFREDGTGYRWLEKTSPNNQYYADNVLNAGYLSTDFNLLNNRLNVFGGVRVEDNRFRILGSYENGLAAYPLVVDQPITSLLPSINASFRVDSSLIIRAGYGKTLNRPEFREAAPMEYTNYVDQETYAGNPGLTTVNIHNAEVRLEWYPGSSRKNEMVNIGFFYKQLDKPIERFRMIYSEGFDRFFYTNTGKANVLGIEAEVRKSFDFIPGKFFRDLSVIMNGSWFKSEVNVPPLPDNVGYSQNGRTRPMQGQSPYLLNASLNYENSGTGSKVAITFNRADDYIYAVGANKGERADADIMLKGRNQLDLTWRQRLNKTFSINAGVQNVLNTPYFLYQDWKNNYRYDKITGAGPDVLNPSGYDDGDVVYRRFYQNPYYSLALNMIF